MILTGKNPNDASRSLESTSAVVLTQFNYKGKLGPGFGLGSGMGAVCQLLPTEIPPGVPAKLTGETVTTLRGDGKLTYERVSLSTR